MISQPAIKDPVTPDGNRVAHRYKVFLPARMITPTGDMRVHLINLSATGTLAHHESPPVANTVIAIEVGGWTMGGRIIWVDGRRFGIAFSGRLDDRRLESLLNGTPSLATADP
jgi:hypothetical protein